MKLANGFKIILDRTKLEKGFRDLYNRIHFLDYGEKTFPNTEGIVDQPHSVKIAAHCVIRKGVVLRPEDGEVVIGDHFVIKRDTSFHGKGGIYLGDWTVIGPHCVFYAQNHSYEFNVNFLNADFFEFVKDKKFDCILFFSVLHWILKEKGINGVRDTLKLFSFSSPVMFFDIGQDHEPKMRGQEWNHELIINKETIPDSDISNSSYRYFKDLGTGDTGRDVFRFTTSP